MVIFIPAIAISLIAATIFVYTFFAMTDWWEIFFMVAAILGIAYMAPQILKMV